MTPGGIYIATYRHTTPDNRHDIVQSTGVVAILRVYEIAGSYVCSWSAAEGSQNGPKVNHYARDLTRGHWLAIEGHNPDFIQVGTMPLRLHYSMSLLGDRGVTTWLDRSLERYWDRRCCRLVGDWKKAIGLVEMMEQSRHAPASEAEVHGAVPTW
jgi:hypothetical protein